MSFDEVFEVITDIDEDIEAIVQMATEIAAGEYNRKNYEKTFTNLEKAGSKLKNINNAAGKLVGVRLLDLVRRLKQYNGTERTRKRILKALMKLDEAVRNDVFYTE